MLAGGWELAAHTLTHPDLTQVDAARLKREVAGSRSVLRRHFGVPVAFFCYPAGRYEAATEAAVRAAGYRGATTTDPGLAAPHGDRFALPRFRVLPEMSPATLLATVR
jgi:peptidoglycan/xylan/chitin deacetylase (PgdA/CDA1 family)